MITATYWKVTIKSINAFEGENSSSLWHLHIIKWMKRSVLRLVLTNVNLYDKGSKSCDCCNYICTSCCLTYDSINFL